MLTEEKFSWQSLIITVAIAILLALSYRVAFGDENKCNAGADCVEHQPELFPQATVTPESTLFIGKMFTERVWWRVACWNGGTITHFQYAAKEPKFRRGAIEYVCLETGELVRLYGGLCTVGTTREPPAPTPTPTVTPVFQQRKGTP